MGQKNPKNPRARALVPISTSERPAGLASTLLSALLAVLLAPAALAGQPAPRDQAPQERATEPDREPEQEEETPPAREGVTDIHIEEEVVVTGTAVRDAPIAAPYSVSVVRRDAIQEQGSPNVTDLFKNLSASTGVIGESNSWFNGLSSGIPETAANVNLRGLGASRTLVLLNGRRQTYVPGRLAGGRFVDVNAMPAMALDRLDVLKEGAGAVYGSDAIAGVVNFITRSGFEGLEVRGAYDWFADAGDGNLGAIWGRHFESGPHVVASFEHQRRAELNSRDRDRSLRPYPGWGAGWSGTGNPGAFIAPGRPVADVDSLAASPRFLDPGCEPMGGYADAAARTCRFRYQPWDNLIAASEHSRGFMEINGSAGESLAYHLEALYADSRIPQWLTTPSFPPVSLFDGTQIVGPDHPGRRAFVESQAAVADTTGAPLDLSGTDPWYFFGRLVGNAGPGRRLARQNRTRRLAGSLRGETVASLDYDLGVAWSDSRGNVNQPAEYAHRKFLAFRGFGGPGCGVGVVVDRAAASGMATGAVPEGVRPGTGNCHYYNPFSNGIEFSAQPGATYETSPNPAFREELANDPDTIAWINEEVDVESAASLLVVDATLNGVAREDAASYALGYQYRLVNASAGVNDAGNLLLNPCPVPGDAGCPIPVGQFTFTSSETPYEARQETHAVFAEAAVKASERLDIQLAAHVERYAQVASFDPKVSASFRLSEVVAARGTAQTTFRTPSVDDLNTSVYTRLQWVPASGTYKAIDTSGSRDLLPEQAFTWNLGLVFGSDETGLEGSIDVWSFDFDNPIGLLPHVAVAAAYAEPTSRPRIQDLVTCPGARRDGSCAPADIERIRITHINWPGIRTSGLDLTLGLRRQVGLGALVASARASYTRDFNVEALSWNDVELVPRQQMAGFLNWNTPIAPPIPKLKGNASLAYYWGLYSAFGAVRYISAYEDRDASSEYRTIDPFLTFDATFRRRFPDAGVTLRLSALNLMDRAPPVANVELGYDALTHDIKGRRIKLAITYRFGS